MSDGDVPARGRRTPVHYSLRVVRAFLARVASGESQASIHRDPEASFIRIKPARPIGFRCYQETASRYSVILANCGIR